MIYSYGRDRLRQLLQAWLVRGPEEALPPGQTVITRRLPQPEFQSLRIRRPLAVPPQALPPGQARIVQPGFAQEVIREQSVLDFRQPEAAAAEGLPEGQSAVVHAIQAVRVTQAVLRSAAIPESLPEGQATVVRSKQEFRAVQPILAPIDPTAGPEALPEGQRAFAHLKITPGLNPSFLFGVVQEIPSAQDLPEGKQILVYPRFPVHVQSLRIRRPSAVPPAAPPPGHQITTRREAISNINESFVKPLPFIPDTVPEDLPPGKSTSTRSEIPPVVNPTFVHPLPFIPDALPPEDLPAGRPIFARSNFVPQVRQLRIFTIYPATRPLPPGTFVTTRLEPIETVNQSFTLPAILIPDAPPPETLPPGQTVTTVSKGAPQFHVHPILGAVEITPPAAVIQRTKEIYHSLGLGV